MMSTVRNVARWAFVMAAIFDNRKSLSATLIAAALASLFAAAPAESAGSTAAATYLSAAGSDGNTSNVCQHSAPCQTFAAALSVTTPGGAVHCLDSLLSGAAVTVTIDVTIDCSNTESAFFATSVNGAFTINALVKVTLRGLNFYTDPSFSGVSGIIVLQGTSVHVENCKIFGLIGTAFDIEPNGPLNLVVSNSSISTSGSGVLLKPAAGGSINAIFDHVAISQNTGGGLKTDTTNGSVTTDITDSIIGHNGGNGINAVASGANQAIVSIEHGVIAKNGAAGVQANGASAGLLLSRTLLDQNMAGALSVVNGGNIFTYGDNRVVGSQGSNFTNTATLK
jgi:hypothetical protein